MNATEIVQRLLPYVSQLDHRNTQSITLVVIHCTELPTLEMARSYGERILYKSGTGNSGHFYIDRDGTVEQWVPADRIAHHVKNHNQASIGIELVNNGRYPEWFSTGSQQMLETYPDMQIDALIRLLNDLSGQLPGLQQLTGHEQLDKDWVPATDHPDQQVRRKRDPGPSFPWPKVLSTTSLNWMDGV